MITELAAPKVAARNGKSVMDVWVDSLTPERREAVLAAVVNRDWGHTALLELLKTYGAPEIADTSFGTWRRKRGLPRVS